jgi:hypothetical protein
VIAGLSGIAARGQRLPLGARWGLGAGLILLALGALGGLGVAFPVLAPAVKTGRLRETLDDDGQWAAPAEDYLRRASRARLGMIERTRRVNQRKAIFLRVAIVVSGTGSRCCWRRSSSSWLGASHGWPPS